MKKKKQAHKKVKQEDQAVTLGDFLNQDIVSKLKDTKQKLKEEEEERLAWEEERRREEKRLREKNKSFEELLNESGMNWKEFK